MAQASKTASIVVVEDFEDGKSAQCKSRGSYPIVRTS